MHNLDLFKLHDIETLQNERLKMSQMLCSTRSADPDLSEDSDEEADTKYNLLDYEEGGGPDMIEEQEEEAECDEIQQNQH